MIKKHLFREENINLFAPSTNEHLYDFIYLLGYKDNDSKNWKARYVVLSIIKELLELKILYIHTWYNDEKTNNDNLDPNEIIDKIDNLWDENTKYPDYYNMMMFGTQKWYNDKLWDLGMTHTTDWKTFVKTKIGNLEKWIKENKPK